MSSCFLINSNQNFEGNKCRNNYEMLEIDFGQCERQLNSIMHGALPLPKLMFISELISHPLSTLNISAKILVRYRPLATNCLQFRKCNGHFNPFLLSFSKIFKDILEKTTNFYFILFKLKKKNGNSNAWRYVTVTLQPFFCQMYQKQEINSFS